MSLRLGKLTAGKLGKPGKAATERKTRIRKEQIPDTVFNLFKGEECKRLCIK